MITFASLGLSEPILRSIATEGYTIPTPIQAQAIPYVLAGRDVLGCAQTGTGKTAAFALPLIQRLAARSAPTAGVLAAGAGADVRPHHAPHPAHSANGAAAHGPRRIRALILAPTRELTLQIAESFGVYGRHTHLRHAVIFGGVNQNPQTRALKAGVDIVVATPGRLMDLMEQGFVDLRHVETFILDEADRMLDMGFIQPIRFIASKVPPTSKRQTLLFSATMPAPIRHLADALLRDPVSVQVAPQASLPDKIDQTVYHVRRADKPQVLNHILTREFVGRALVFTRTKHGADKLVRHLYGSGIHAEAIHGNKRQNVRQRTLANFKEGRTNVLVATDIAARGIDVDDITHVVNFDIPHEAETYVHRIGRTARAGAAGIAIALCDTEERGDLKAIERLLKKSIDVGADLPRFAPVPYTPPAQDERRQNGRPAPRTGGGAGHARRGQGSGSGHGGHGHTSGAAPRPAHGTSHSTRSSTSHRPGSGAPATSSPSAGPKRPHNPLARHRKGGRPHGAGGKAR